MTNIPLKPENEQFTDGQWRSIFDSGDNLLISASAGSGKTTVLVRRVIEKLKSGTNIDELLIVTFTEAAAREMKERIQQALQEAVNGELPGELQHHFAKQLTLLPTAHISTLHAFCLTVIRRFHYLVKIDPVFRLLTDETETLLLKEEVWDDLRESFYEENREIFYRVTANFSNDRNDQGLQDLVESLYEFSRANPDPTGWLQNLVALYEIDDLNTAPLYQEAIKPQLLQQLKSASRSYQEAVVLAQADPGLAKILAVAAKEKNACEAALAAISGNDLSTAYQQIAQLTFDRYPGSRKAELKDYSNEIKGLRDHGKGILETLKAGIFAESPEEQVARMQKALPLVQELSRIGQAFLQAYSRRKQEKGLVDFNDLEHFTLQLLTEEHEEKLQPSVASKYYRGKFKEVLVDEYQDVNRLQEAILYWLRTPEPAAGNLFMVGDVKQSIYSFRLADPTLFIEKYTAYETAKNGRRIILAENFRSRKEVLDFTNLIFMQLMDAAVGQLDYDEDALLVNGFKGFPESSAFLPELLIYEKDAQDEDAADFIEDKVDGELYMTGLKIRELVDQKFLIWDKKTKSTRPLAYKDIVLLTPTKKNNLAILDTFKELEIPLEVNDAQNYFQATEIRLMIALLQILDNPYQDIPLAAVLRSPFVGLTEPELAEIRLKKTKGTFYDAYRDSLGSDAVFSAKLRAFDELFLKWRAAARKGALTDLLISIYEETGYLEYVLGLPVGTQRHANLLALIDRAREYENSSFRGLYQFIRFIEKMQIKDKDLAEPVIASQEDAVRVMTIHASKGLEFPVVFILNLTKEFNLQDAAALYIFDEKRGAGIKVLDPDTRVRSETLPFQALKQLKLQKLLSEEMRKLYVGLTRAEQKLFLVGSYDSQAAMLKLWSQSSQNSEQVIDAALRLKGKSSLMNWIGWTLFRHPKMAAYQQEYDTATLASLTEHPGDFTITWVSQQELAEQKAQLELAQKPSTNTQEELPDIPVNWRNVLEFDYPHQKATQTASYQSVSEIKRLFQDPDEQEASRLIWQPATQQAQSQTYRFTQAELAKPTFLQKTVEITSAAVGTATHLVLQQLPLDKLPTKESLEAVITDLIESGQLEPAVAKRIRRERLLAFFETPLGRSLVEHSQLVKREEPFAMLYPAKEIFAEFDSEDELLIHGIVDGYLEYEDHIVLYDFKTDHLPADQSPQLLSDRYRGQLRLYQKALEEALAKPVTEVYLVLLEIGKVLELSEKK